MYAEFENLLQSYPPEAAAKIAVRNHKNFFETLDDEESDESDDCL
jgi:hypothetical protein